MFPLPIPFGDPYIPEDIRSTLLMYGQSNYIRLSWATWYVFIDPSSILLSTTIPSPYLSFLNPYYPMMLAKIWLICLSVWVTIVLALPNDGTIHHVNRDDTSESPDSLSPFSFTLSRFDIPDTLHDSQNKRLVELLESRAVCRVACNNGGCCASSCW